MQVNATVIAAQQAAREARAQLFAQAPAAPKPAASFLTELTGEASAQPAQTKPTAAPATAPEPQTFSRPGSLLDIKV